MINTLFNWIKFDVQNFIAEVWWAVLILWVALLVTAITDIATNTLTRTTKAVWISIVSLVPMAGLFTYCIFCLTRVDYHWLEFLFVRRKSSRRKASMPSSSL